MKVSASRPGGSWLQQNYDKLALVLSLALLLLSAVFLVLRTGGEQKAFNERMGREAGQSGLAAIPVDTTGVSNLLAVLADPYQVSPAERRLLVGELRVASIPDGAPIPFNATTDPFSGKPQPAVDFDPDSDEDGIPDKAETQWGLNPSDPSDARGDQDQDGYSNLEEYMAGSDPRDSASFPPPAAKLRLVRTVVNPFRFRFLGISRLPDGDRYQLNLRTLERTYFARAGEEIEGFKIVSYEEKTPEGPTLVLQQGAQVIRLIQGRVINQEARTAHLVFLVDATRYRLQLNDEFRIKDRTYKVVDIREDRIVIRDQQDGKLATVGPLTPEDRARLQGGAMNVSEPPGGRIPNEFEQPGGRMPNIFGPPGGRIPMAP